MTTLESNFNSLTSEVKALKTSNTQMKELLDNINYNLVVSSSSSQFIADESSMNIHLLYRTLEEFKLNILNERKMYAYILPDKFKEMSEYFQ